MKKLLFLSAFLAPISATVMTAQAIPSPASVWRHVPQVAQPSASVQNPANTPAPTQPLPAGQGSSQSSSTEHNALASGQNPAHAEHTMAGAGHAAGQYMSPADKQGSEGTIQIRPRISTYVNLTNAHVENIGVRRFILKVGDGKSTEQIQLSAAEATPLGAIHEHGEFTFQGNLKIGAHLESASAGDSSKLCEAKGDNSLAAGDRSVVKAQRGGQNLKAVNVSVFVDGKGHISDCQISSEY